MNTQPKSFGFTPHVLSHFTALAMNKMAPAGDDTGSAPTLGDWAPQEFIGEELTSRFGDDDDAGNDGDKAVKTDKSGKLGETVDDEENDDDDNEEENEEEDDDNEEENDEGDEEESDEESDEDDDDEDDNDDEENDEESDKGSEEKTSAVKGLQREVIRQRRRAQEAEDELREISRRLAEARKLEAEELPKLHAEMRELLREQNKARIDEDLEAATEAGMKLEDVRRRIARIDGKADKLADDHAREDRKLGSVIKELANAAVAEYPILDDKSKEYDEEVVTMVNALYTELAKKTNSADAFAQAVDRVMRRLKVQPKGAKAEPKGKRDKAAEKAKREAVARRRKAAEATPRGPSSRRSEDYSSDGDFKYRASDFNTEKGRKKLREKLGIRLPV